MSKQKISVIIPARNEADKIALLLTSIREQTFAPCEVIVVDDQSSDRTAEIAYNYGAIVLKVSYKPDDWMGKNYALWIGARASLGDYLLFLDADTVLEKTFNIYHYYTQSKNR